MNVFVYPTTKDFLIAASDLLQSDEARFGLIYGIARLVDANPHYFGEEEPWFCTVGDSGGICALSWRTPPYPVGLAWYAGNPEEAVLLLIEAIRDRWGAITGVVGDREVADPFAARWCRTYGTSIKSTIARRIYRLDSVNDVPYVSGRIRQATLVDKDLISGWIRAFWVEAGSPASEGMSERDITLAIKNGECYLWDVGQPVSMAMKSRPTVRGMSVNYVYTPLEVRRKGYATACVAGVCREILKSGYDFCTLYADLSNPTSNSIYMKIGFKPVCDSVQYTFSPQSA